MSTFSGQFQSESLDELKETVEKIIHTVPPASVPLLTLVLMPTESIKKDYWKVCQKLGSSRSFYENRGDGGKWVELIDIDDVKCPKPNGLDIPTFMEFDRSIGACETHEKTVSNALDICRAKMMVVIDLHEHIDRDIVFRIMDEIEKKVKSPLGFKMYQK